MITLSSFVVLKKLSVRNIQINPGRIRATYQIQTFTDELKSYDLVYKYNHNYFTRGNANDVNLASIILAQVAINYGLFFKTIEFDGLYDKADIKFIKTMMENTTREILTNKLLVNNPFIKPSFKLATIDKRKDYTQAELVFNNSRFSGVSTSNEMKKPDLKKYSVLSSGGKDSLLTYGILKETGNVYPVFINEAGRHWFTAVNAYRYLKKTESHTEKVWCNCDRVFNWILKQFPFIRENFSNIRADIYPIRLWTVAVFLFGSLPVVRKKGIGNIVIGNEYDTTVISSSHGIKHYNGLYDQSKYFDNTLTRYYKNKGWNINQFSLLRSLSELLIMKILIKRYPALQQQQVSCHAAHAAKGRMLPCGKCEKCRRIIGMIKALDENPQLCGYNKAQIKNGLKALEEQSVKQIGSDAAHLYYLLLTKGLLKKNEHTIKMAREHREITHLRFDTERSNLEDLPAYIRKPLFKILLLFANGTVIRKDGRWHKIKLDNKFLNSKNYIMDKK